MNMKPALEEGSDVVNHIIKDDIDKMTIFMCVHYKFCTKGSHIKIDKTSTICKYTYIYIYMHKCTVNKREFY